MRIGETVYFWCSRWHRLSLYPRHIETAYNLDLYRHPRDGDDTRLHGGNGSRSSIVRRTIHSAVSRGFSFRCLTWLRNCALIHAISLTIRARIRRSPVKTRCKKVGRDYNCTSLTNRSQIYIWIWWSNREEHCGCRDSWRMHLMVSNRNKMSGQNPYSSFENQFIWKI